MIRTKASLTRKAVTMTRLIMAATSKAMIHKITEVGRWTVDLGFKGGSKVSLEVGRPSCGLSVTMKHKLLGNATCRQARGPI